MRINKTDFIKIAFYKPTKKDIWGNLISGWTWLFNRCTPNYSHVELGFKVDNEWKYYSSASKNTNSRSGTRWLNEQSLFKHPERWDVYEIRPIYDQKAMIDRASRELFKRYDWFGIFGFITIFGQINSKNRWYCSEICHYVFFGRWKKRISPRRLYSIIKPYILDKSS